MSDLSAAERIAAEALPDDLGAARRDVFAAWVVAALVAAGWLVEPVERACGLAGCTSCAEQLPDRSRP